MMIVVCVRFSPLLAALMVANSNPEVPYDLSTNNHHWNSKVSVRSHRALLPVTG